MSSAINKWIGTGNLTRDPELKYAANGNPCTKFTIASNHSFKPKDGGEFKEDPAFIPITVWGGQAEPCSKYLSKGRKVAVEGRLRTYDWADAEGVKHYGFEVKADSVEFIGSKGADESPASTTEEVPF